jgi:hypothetical protein
MNRQMLLLVLVSALIALAIFGTLLIQLGCYLTRAEVPSFKRAFLVLLGYMVGGFFVNREILNAIALLLVAMEVDLSDDPGKQRVRWVARGVQFVADMALFAGIAYFSLNKVTLVRGLLIGLVLSIGMVALGFLASVAVGGLTAMER